jgi:parallel beta-helix repeat protein
MPILIFPDLNTDPVHRPMVGGRNVPRRRCNQRAPLGESLEGRICLSTITPSSGTDRSAHVSPVNHGVRHSAVRVEPIHDLVTINARHQQKKVKGPLTVSVKPGAKSGPKSLATALKQAKSGERIVLAPGVYTQNLVINKKTNVTIVGAANQSSILAPANGDALTVTSSSNITISNVWFRSQGSQGRGLIVRGSSVSVQNIKTDGTQGDGAWVTGYNGVNANFTATSSHFDGIQTASGLDLRGGSSSTINGCTFNNDGTSPNVTLSSVGLVLAGNATANIINSQFIGNTNSGLVALQNSQVTAEQSVFSNNRKGDGALFVDSSVANLVDNTFASNGEIRGAGPGFNGVEFEPGFTGTGTLTGNLFQDNTASGLWIGSAPNNIQVLNNTFDNNYAGVFLDSTAGAVSATIQGNTIDVPLGATVGEVGILLIGPGVTATVGGDGALANTIENYVNGEFIHVSSTNPNGSIGNPNATILGNVYLRAGVAISPADAITISA